MSIVYQLYLIIRLGGGPAKSSQDKGQFDIVKELQNMKPLRKVSRDQLDIGEWWASLIT